MIVNYREDPDLQNLIVSEQLKIEFFVELVFKDVCLETLSHSFTRIGSKKNGSIVAAFRDLMTGR